MLIEYRAGFPLRSPPWPCYHKLVVSQDKFCTRRISVPCDVPQYQMSKDWAVMSGAPGICLGNATGASRDSAETNCNEIYSVCR